MPGERPDLDQLEALARGEATLGPWPGVVLTLVAELRAERGRSDRLKADLGIVGNELGRMRIYAVALRDSIAQERASRDAGDEALLDLMDGNA